LTRSYRKNGIKVAALTNNWYGPEEIPEDTTTHQSNSNELYEFLRQFDAVIESRVVKMRKPDPRIYSMMCDKLDVQPSECVYLDGMYLILIPLILHAESPLISYHRYWIQLKTSQIYGHAHNSRETH
jgi:epoxide hydrolase-like predicted phosphatase